MQFLGRTQFFVWQSVTAVMKQSRPLILLAVLVSSAVLSSFFFARFFLLQPPDTTHLTDMYHHSQWAVPLSSRSISDDQLYLVAGVELARGAEPFSINPEVPPLGKYLYGFGYLVFGNPFLVGALLYVGVVWLVYALARSLGASCVRAGLAALVVSLSPAVASQVTQTMLDLPLMFFLLLHLWLLSSLRVGGSGKNATDTQYLEWLKLVGAGVALGAFAGTKFPLFAPVLVLADLAFFWRVGQVRKSLVVFVMAGVTFLAAYTRYFLEGHSLLEWLKSLYWTVQFYQAGTNEHPFGQVISAVLFGQFQESIPKTLVLDTLQVTENTPLQLAKVREWSLVWPLGLLTLGWVALQRFLPALGLSALWHRPKKQGGHQISPAQQLVIVLSLLYLALLLVVEFKARYFFPLLPVLIALSSAVVSLRGKTAQLLVGVGLVALVLQYLAFWHTPPTEIVKEIERTWNDQNYQDLYSFVVPGSTGVNRGEFQRIVATELNQNIRVVEQKVAVSLEPLGSMGTVGRTELVGEITLSFSTPDFTVEKRVPVAFTNHNGQWFLQWDWGWYVAGFDPSCRVSTRVKDEDGAGALIDQDGSVLARYEPVEYLRFVTSGLVADQLTIFAVAPLTNNEELRAQNFLLNTISGREWYDFPIRISELSPVQRAVFPERQQVWTRLERTKNTELSELERKQVELLEAQHPELTAQATVHIDMSCDGGYKQLVIPGTRKSIRL